MAAEPLDPESDHKVYVEKQTGVSFADVAGALLERETLDEAERGELTRGLNAGNTGAVDSPGVEPLAG